MKKDFVRNTLLIGGIALCLLVYRYAEGELNMNAGSLIAGFVLLPVVSFVATVTQRSRDRAYTERQERRRPRQRRNP